MSQFYGIISGQAKTSATRQGSKKSGLETIAASWQGSIYVFLWHDDIAHENRYKVRLEPWQGQGKSKTLAEGVFGK